MQALIEQYVKNPNSSTLNIELAGEYEKIGQLASGVTHYLKAADYSINDKANQYLALSGAARCFRKAGGREGTVEGLLKRCVTLEPKLSDPYLELSTFYEAKKDWFSSYMMASLGLSNATDFSYKLLFQKAVAAWWIGNAEEARQIIFCLYKQRDKMEPYFYDLMDRNLYGVGEPYEYLRYHKEDIAAAKRTFPGMENIESNYSQCYQDLFPLLITNGAKGGFYLEIGSSDPIRHNNTYLLEKDFDWKGISIDIDFSHTQKFRAIRKNECLQVDATTLDYKSMLDSRNAPKMIDYLQIDVDPPQDLSLTVLKRIPFDDYQFRVITFEHNTFETDPKVRLESRQIIMSKGYTLVVSDVAPRVNKPFEDWYVHNSVFVEPSNFDLTPGSKTARSYFFDEDKLEKIFLTRAKNWYTL